MTGFSTEYDIGNRAAQHCRADRFVTFADYSTSAQEIGFVYDKKRLAELRRRNWVFSMRRNVLRAVSVTTLLWTPPAYSATTTYPLGAVVVDTNGDWWQSTVPSNVGIAPTIPATQWTRYVGPDSMDPFSPAASTTASQPQVGPTLSAVNSGSLGARTVYVKLTYTTANGEALASPESTLTLLANQVVSVASPPATTNATGYSVYASTVSGGTETLQQAGIAIGTPWQEPNTGFVIGSFPPGSLPTAYHAGELVYYGGQVYLSLVDNNQDTPPTINWLAVNGTTQRLQILYPAGCGPRTDQISRNVFRRPRGWLRKAPSDPKAGHYFLVGVQTGPAAEDWVLDGDYIVTMTFGPIMVRFVADFVDVPNMDPMFCEALAASIATEVAPRIVIPTDGWSAKDAAQMANAHYKREIADAGEVNGIEAGPVSSPIDDWITVRY